MTKKSDAPLTLGQMSLEDLRALNARLAAQINALREEQRQITRWMDIRSYEAGETPTPPPWNTSPDQLANGNVAIGRGE